MSQAKLLNYPSAQNPSVSSLSKDKKTKQPAKEAVKPTCFASHSEHPFDVISAAQASLSFVQSSFGQNWDAPPQPAALEGLNYILRDINESLQYAKDLLSSGRQYNYD